MYFIKITQRLYAEDGKFSGVTIEVTPIFANNRDANTAIYRELWHRLRRDNHLKAETFGSFYRSDPGVIYFSGAESSDNAYRANIMVSHGKGHHLGDAETNVKKTLKRMDRLLRTLVFSGKYDLTLSRIAHKINIERKIGEVELKTLLKIFCRSQGMFVDDADVSYAIIQAKERRRETYFSKHPEYKHPND